MLKAYHLMKHDESNQPAQRNIGTHRQRLSEEFCLYPVANKAIANRVLKKSKPLQENDLEVGPTIKGEN